MGTFGLRGLDALNASYDDAFGSDLVFLDASRAPVLEDFKLAVAGFEEEAAAHPLTTKRTVGVQVQAAVSQHTVRYAGTTPALLPSRAHGISLEPVVVADFDSQFGSENLPDLYVATVAAAHGRVQQLIPHEGAMASPVDAAGPVDLVLSGTLEDINAALHSLQYLVERTVWPGSDTVHVRVTKHTSRPAAGRSPGAEGLVATLNIAVQGQVEEAQLHWVLPDGLPFLTADEPVELTGLGLLQEGAAPGAGRVTANLSLLDSSGSFALNVDAAGTDVVL